MRFFRPFAALACLILVAATFAIPASGSRKNEGGWIVVQLSGTPSQIGFEHGSLLANEIKATLGTLKAEMPIRSHQDWNWFRANAQRLFWPKLDPEYKAEISGIAAGAQSKGVNVDAQDILAMNGYIELWMYYLPVAGSSAMNFTPRSGAPDACSAFVATGSETKDGKVVMAQNFWWDYIMGEHWNVIFDITPEHGNRFVMDALPGLIMSGSDWGENSAGIALTETTIDDFVGFNPNGAPEFERMRRAIQYSKSLDDVCRYLETDNNGAYANTWLMADAKTGEIGKLELGLKNVTFQHTKDGYYFGCNFPENPKLIAEEASQYSGGEQPRINRWQQDLVQNKGKIDLNLAEQFVCDSYDERTRVNDGMGGALCGKSTDWGAVSARATDADMLLNMQFMARFGIPDGSTLSATKLLASNPEFQSVPIFDLPSHPWVEIGGSTR